jgi:pyruvate kinase
MALPPNKTKIVCTIGPASESPEIMEKMILAGMNVARLNFSHGDFEGHKKAIENLRSAAKATGRRVAILADLPGPKIRIGELAEEPIELEPDRAFTLTTEEIVGDSRRASVSFPGLPRAVKPGDILYLSDGYIQIKVIEISGNDIVCRVVAGGELRSRKGLNLPGIDLGISAFTEHDRECLKFSLEHGVDAVSQSFVEKKEDIIAVRQAALELGHHPFIIGKIERARAKDNLEEIIDAADGIMIARGDLGVEIPIERIAIAQKDLMYLANKKGKPVITATQMLESMTDYPRPTRAESTDVANAILDGTDCVMLSGESAMGKYPVEAVKMLSKIAATVEPRRPGDRVRNELRACGRECDIDLKDLIALSVETSVETVSPAALIVPSKSGASVRSITRFRLPVWIAAVSSNEATCQQLQFSYGVQPFYLPDDEIEDWNSFARDWLKKHELEGDLVILAAGPSPRHPKANNRMEIIDLRKK